MTAVTLVGFMGAGKTTVGRALAARLGWHFQDLDDLIQAREGRTIEELFKQKGEAAFRELECLVLKETIGARTAALVLALGGGAFIEPQNQGLLRQGKIPAVFLDAPADELFSRSEQPGVKRPLRQNVEQFHALYERRRPAYMKADFRIETGGKTIARVVEEIRSRLELGASE